MSAPQFVVDTTVDNVIKAVGLFVTPFLPTGTPIIRGQVNRVSMPPVSAAGFVKLTEILQVDLSTPLVTYDGGGAQASIMGPKRIDIQIDFYGPSAGDYCAALKGVWRTSFATSAFPANIQPLYCSDGHQSPLTDAEQQYETRWTITASLQYNPSVIMPQDYATELSLNILEDLP